MSEKPTPIKLTLKRSAALALYAALGRLTTFDKAVGDGIAKVPYRFTDDTRKLIKKNRIALKEIAEEHDEKNQELITKITSLDGVTPGPAFIDKKDEAKNADYQVQYVKYLKEPVDIEVFHIEESALLSENKNPILFLEDLAPITDAVVAPAKNEPEGGQ